MRIISGEFGGRKLLSLSDQSVRPATDRVKGTIFNMLQNRLSLEDANVLDLFAGTGSLGFEALSRGAGQVVFIESSPKAAGIIEKNAEQLSCAERCEILRAEAMQYLRFCKEKFDLIFADPPYAFPETGELPSIIFSKKLLNNGGFLIIEHTKLVTMQSTADYKVTSQREFGQTRVSFFTYPETQS